VTLGSLFDGIGGFPLAAQRHGIKPIWASEKELNCISITKRHFSEMKHLGDITKINGAKIERVDIVSFGSPCQDLSQAGNRDGIEGDESKLFFEAIRIIKEMRIKTNGKYPIYAIWENVTGAFSSNKGEDFKTVIEEIANISETVSIPKSKKWEPSGFILGNSWSLAWRTLNSEYWGVPQRRNRIFLIADFRGERAGEILFKPESLQGDSKQSRKTRKGIAGNSKRSVRAAGFNGFRSVTGTLEYKEDRAPCIQKNMPPNVVIGFDGYNQNLTGGVLQTIRGQRADGDNVGMVLEQYAVDFGRTADRIQMNAKTAVTLQSEGGGGGAKTGLYCLPTLFSYKSFGEYKQDEVCKSLMKSDDITTGDLILQYRVRRLTPLECERAQGFPDYWTKYGDNKQISDSARYKVLGNSLAIPCVEFIFNRIIGV